MIAKLSTAAMTVTAALAFGTLAKAQEAAKCHLQQIASIPVIVRDNKPLVEVMIDGKKALMLADSGAERSLLFVNQARALGLKPVGSEGTFVGTGGEREAYSVTIAQFGFGDTTVKNLRLFALDGGFSNDVVGVFGEDFLGQTDSEFDLAHGAIRLFSEQDCGNTNLAYWTKEPSVAEMNPAGAEFRLPLKLNGVTVYAMLDSGAQVSVVSTQVANRLGVRIAAGDPVTIMHGIGEKAVEFSSATFDRLAVGDEEIKNVKLKVGRLSGGQEETYIDVLRNVANDNDELLLGADFIRSHRIFVSIKQKRMYFTYAGGPVFQVVAPPPSEPAAH